MSPVKHAAVSGAASVVFAYFSGSLGGAVVCFLSGIFIDIDHFIDYWIVKRELFFTFKELDAFFTYVPEGQLRLLFHSYELLLILWLVWLFDTTNMIMLGLVSGMSLHMFMDFFVNPVKPLAYFFIYRFKHKFEKESIFVEHYYDRFHEEV